MHGDEQTVFEYAADLVRYYTWFVDAFVDPTVNDALIDKLWLQASNKLRLPVKMSANAKTFVSDMIHALDDVCKLTLFR